MKGITIRNNELFCLNCGQSYKLQYPIPVIELSKKIKAFDVLHENCPKTWEEPKVDQSKSIEEKAFFWFQNGERGASSETIWFCCMNKEVKRVCYPYDPDDFKRCYKLFQAVPEWRTDLYMQKIAMLCPEWKNLIDNWQRLTEMYEENVRDNWKNHKKIGMYELMKQCITIIEKL